MSIRTYNPSVRVGNWNEDLWLEEDLLKDFVTKRDNQELLIQKSPSYYHKILSPVTLKQTNKEYVSYGDILPLYHPETKEMLSIYLTNNQLYEMEEEILTCGVTSSVMGKPTYRNAFQISPTADTSEASDGMTLKYGDKFFLSTLSGVAGGLNLRSERATLVKSAKKSRHNEVTLTTANDYSSYWHILHFDPQQRLESEGRPVPANSKIVLVHSKTNEGLAALDNHIYNTPFGKEHEVVAHTFLDSHKAEKPQNHWCFLSVQ